jgi:uncharacterized membrane protein YhhN
MLVNVIFTSIAVGAVISLLHAIRVGDRPLEVLSKSAASAAFVVLGFARWSAGDPVGAWLIAGLALCAVGDICLLWEKSFDFGVISFLLGHLAYVTAFSKALHPSHWLVLVAAALAVAGTVAGGWWLWPHLERRRSMITAYMMVISVMVWGAVSASIRSALPWTAAAGALLFYCSDLAVARQRFVHRSFLNRAIGLPVYYLGQILLALTIGSS